MRARAFNGIDCRELLSPPARSMTRIILLTSTSSSSSSSLASSTSSGTGTLEQLPLQYHAEFQRYQLAQQQREQQQQQLSAAAKGGFLDKHFATSSAIRDFNESMPVLSLPTGFKMKQGHVVHSDPTSRLKQLQDEEQEYEYGDDEEARQARV
mmetsp:Transcript_30273/g.50672  ORF Transcript_30273/g.50672 Transcript_30273/m.50672 type:complete len:153 (-) Transcript_30273:137-595(-)